MAGKGCEYMGIYRAIAGITIVCTLFGLIEGTSMIACASEEKLVQYDVASSERDQYCVLTEEIGTYKVCEGDNLWRISETLLGNGKKLYTTCNAECRSDCRPKSDISQYAASSQTECLCETANGREWN